MPKKKKSPLLFIFVTLLIDCTGIGIIIPVVPSLIQQLSGANLSEASKFGGWLTFAYAAMQFVCSPILGGLSDRFGRRPILLISLMGLGLDYLFLFFAPSLAWLFLGRLIAGVCGASFTTASAYIADISEPEKRAQNFGMIGAAFGLGFIIGPLIGGVFGHIGVRIPFLVAAVLSLLNWIYGYFVLPESLLLENRRRFDWTRANPLGSLKHLKRYPAILGLIGAMVLIYIAGHAAQSTWTYFTMEKFKWNEEWVGYSLAFVGVSVAIVQGGLIRLTQKKWGSEKSIYIGLCFTILGLVLFAFAFEGWQMFVFIVFYSLGGIAGPAIQGTLSSHVPANEQGELQGALTSLMSLTSIVGPLLMTGLFSYFTSQKAPLYFPGAPFMMGAILTGLSLLLAWMNLRKKA
jgi:DHA1 family tetracycline resistance protein-like MFS transporter